MTIDTPADEQLSSEQPSDEQPHDERNEHV